MSRQAYYVCTLLILMLTSLVGCSFFVPPTVDEASPPPPITPSHLPQPTSTPLQIEIVPDQNKIIQVTTEVICKYPIKDPAEDQAPESLTIGDPEGRNLIIFERRPGFGSEKKVSWLIYDFTNEHEYEILDGFIPIAWSPGGSHLLFQNEEKILITSSRGDDPKVIYSGGGDCPDLIPAAWINDDMIAAYEGDVHLCSHLMYLDLSSGEVLRPVPDQFRTFQASIPMKDRWLELIMSACEIDATYTLELVDSSWNRMKLQSDYEIRPPEFPIGHPREEPTVFLLPDGERVIYETCEWFDEISVKCSIILSRIDGNALVDNQVIYYQPMGNMSVRLSPDGSQLAIIDYWGILHIIDIEQNLPSNRFVWDQRYGPPELIWSPNSRYVGTILDDPSYYLDDVSDPVFGGYDTTMFNFTPFLITGWTSYSARDWRTVAGE